MECNKNEAVRAKKISEAKLVEKDILGAKKFAQKAETLFPGLEGLSELLRTLDVYVSLEKKINGETDWYSVLGVDPTAHDETIRKSYRKLVLSLHPDKNKSVGAEGAFKLVSEAWSMLSDKFKRREYDQKRNRRPVYQKVATQNTTSPAGSNAKTFWTSCTKCLMHFEYLKVYLNQKIRCTNCREPFWAVELPLQPRNHPATMWYSQRQNHKANNRVNVQQGLSLKSSAVKRSGNLKRGHEERTFQASNSGLKSGIGDGIVKKRRIVEQSSTAHASNAYEKGHSGERVSVSRYIKHDHSTRELSQMEIRNMLVAKARKEVIKKMEEWSMEKASRNEGRARKGEKLNSSTKDSEEINVNDMNMIKDEDVKIPSQNTIDTNSVDSDGKDETGAVLMSVPDPDFHDFDNDRTEHSFGENQIWAAYDDDDGMPRYYALIHGVISRRPFKMRISWLNSNSNAELGPIDWVASGFPKTCGDFRTGEHVVNTSLNSFSHKVQWTKGHKGAIQIFPRKGDVWALYRNWSPDWNTFTPNDIVHKYDMVVVVEDYNEKGVMVVPLVKVVGFKSMFHQHSDVTETWMIPREEIFRLSHQVPFYTLIGDEARNVPKGCKELDPAALPLELLQTTTETMEIRSGSKELHMQGSSKRTEDKGIVTYARKTAKNTKLKGKIIDKTKKVKEETKVGAGFKRRRQIDLE